VTDFAPLTEERKQAIAAMVEQKYGHACRAAVELAFAALTPSAPAPSMADMRMLIQRLSHSLRKASPDNVLSDQAMDYLKRTAPIGSPLRDGE